jgi:hypothetical protein
MYNLICFPLCIYTICRIYYQKEIGRWPWERLNARNTCREKINMWVGAEEAVSKLAH